LTLATFDVIYLFVSYKCWHFNWS